MYLKATVLNCDLQNMASGTNRILVCRYCLNDSRNVAADSFTVDETEEFENMITDTFSIQICHLSSMDKIICLQCIKNFRHAFKVKKKILEVQRVLLDQVDIITDTGCESPKQDIDSSGYDEYDYSTGDDVNIDGDCKIIHNPDLEDGYRLSEENVFGKTCVIKIEPENMDGAPLKMRKTVIKKISKSPRVSEPDAVEIREIEFMKTENGTEETERTSEKNQTTNASTIEGLKKIRNNTLKLLTNSNMSPFVSKRTKYACYSCTDSFLDIRQLREHYTLHPFEFRMKADINKCRGMSYKNVDISNLTCKICSDHCTNIDTLQEHLENKHDLTFDGSEHLLLPFKLEEGFKCVLCQESHNTFTRLAIHMNTHSTSNFCEICGATYINRISLRNHINAVHTKKQCSKCSSVFPTISAKEKHMRIVHNKARSRRYCMKCEMTFAYTHQLRQHMIEKHGEKREVLHCEHCGKKFSAAGNLKIHIRSVHIGERNYPCSICDLRFFTSCDKARHEKTHGDEKAYSCEFCEVKFRSKDSQRRHLRRQHGKSKSGRGESEASGN